MVEWRVVELIVSCWLYISEDEAYITVVHDGDRPRYETILHTGTRSVWTVQDANTPTRSGEIRIGCGKD